MPTKFVSVYFIKCKSEKLTQLKYHHFVIGAIDRWILPQLQITAILGNCKLREIKVYCLLQYPQLVHGCACSI